MTLTSELADFVCTCDLSAIPSSVREAAGVVMLDGLGCALGAAGLQQSQAMIQAVLNAAGDGPCRVIGRPEQISSPLAAYINAKLGNLMDMDDVWRNIGHQSPVVLYPTLSEGEARGASGAQVLAAFIVGFEIASRVVAALGSLFNVKDGKASPSHLTGFGHSIFGGAAAAGRLARLEKGRMLQALGIAGLYSPASLSHKSVMNMNMSKYQLDLAAMGAVMAARQAEAGVTGCATILDDGLYAKAMGKGGFWPEHLTEGLGDRWAVAETSLKPYPHCRHTHYALDLLDSLLKENAIKPQEIEVIEVTGLRNYVVHPWNVTAPEDPFQAQFSLPCALALVALGIPPGPAWMDPELITSDAVRSITSKVIAEENPEILPAMIEAYPQPEMRIPTKVVVKTAKGAFEANTEFARGDQFEKSQRMDREQVAKKFQINSDGLLDRDSQTMIIDMVLTLEKVPHIGKLMELLQPH